MVAAFALLAGCSMFTRNDDLYRQQVAATIGNEEVSVQEITAFFESNGVMYINYGLDPQTVWDMLIPQYINQIIAVNEYKAANQPTNNSSKAQLYKDAGYLTDDDIVYFEKSVQFSMLEALDSTLESIFTANGYVLEGEEEAERVELTEFVIAEKSLALATRDNALSMKQIDKDLEDYKKQTSTTSIEYVFDLGDELLAEKVEEFNKLYKNEERGEVTAEMYIDAQKSAMSQFQRNMLASGFETYEEYFKASVENIVRQQLYIDYQTQKNKELEMSEEDFLALLNKKLENLTKQQEEEFAKNPAAFTTLIGELKADSFIYTVPEMYEGKYGFVKNLLIPFSGEQTKVLTEYSRIFGATSAQYLKMRADLAKEIEVTDFYNDDKDAEKANAGFVVNGTEVVGSTFFEEKLNGVTLEGFVDLMFQYNTDTAQHNSAYGYVIAKETPDATGTADTWVKEFAAEARRLANEGTVGGIGYALTDYGVHIIFYEGDVVADTFDTDDWSDALQTQKGAGNASYRFYKTYFDAVKSEYYNDIIEELYQQYEEGGKIKINKAALRDYCKDYGIEP